MFKNIPQENLKSLTNANSTVLSAKKAFLVEERLLKKVSIIIN